MKKKKKKKKQIQDGWFFVERERELYTGNRRRKIR